MIRYNGIHHLAMVTGDMDGTIRFWRDLLGMRMIAGIGRKGYRHYFFEVSPGAMIAFFEWPRAAPIPEKEAGTPAEGPLVFDHVSLEVTTEDHLWLLKARLEGADVWVSEVIDHGFIHSIFCFDPNGISLEFSVRIPGVDLSSRPMMNDAGASEVTREGPEPQKERWPQPKAVTPPQERRTHPGELKKILLEEKNIWDRTTGNE